MKKGRSHPFSHLSFSTRPGKIKLHLIDQYWMIWARLSAALSKGDSQTTSGIWDPLAMFTEGVQWGKWQFISPKFALPGLDLI